MLDGGAWPVIDAGRFADGDDVTRLGALAQVGDIVAHIHRGPAAAQQQCRVELEVDHHRVMIGIAVGHCAVEDIGGPAEIGVVVDAIGLGRVQPPLIHGADIGLERLAAEGGVEIALLAIEDIGGGLVVADEVLDEVAIA